MATEKLQIINEMKRRYPGWINPDLLSTKFCRNSVVVFLEMTFSDELLKPLKIDLDFISNDELDGSLFLPEIDIIDNAKVFVELDQYSLYYCVDGLFTKDADHIIKNKNIN